MDSKDIGREWEREFAKIIGGTVTKGSGNQWHTKLDVKGKSMLWSLKATSKQSFSVTRGVLSELERSALGPGSVKATPGLAIKIQDEKYVVLRLEDFINFMSSNQIEFTHSNKDQKKERASIPRLLRSLEKD